MKLPSSRTLPTTLRTRRGFALVATISVMILLVMIALAMLSLATLEMRASRNSDARIEAQANARLALLLAIGQAQEQLGPDQISTAQAAILVAGARGDSTFPSPDPSNPANEYLTGSNPVRNPHWLGTFPTYEPNPADPFDKSRPWIRRPVDTGDSSELYLYDARFSSHRMTEKPSINRAQYAQWLVSNPSPSVTLNPATMTPKPLTGTLSDFDPLVANGAFNGPLMYPSTTSGVFQEALPHPENAPALATIEARAPIVPIKNSAGVITGGYAYMLSDESLKYKTALAHSVEQTASNAPNINDPESYAQLVTPQNVHLEGLLRHGSVDDMLQHLSHDSGVQPYKQITLASVPLQADALKDTPATHFSPFFRHSLTVYGHGLLTNPVSGGLKRNLSSYLERPSTGANRNEQITPITAAREIGNKASSALPDSISDVSSILLAYNERDSETGASHVHGSMTTATDGDQKLSLMAPVLEQLRSFVQLRNTTSNPDNKLTLKNPEIASKPAAQATRALLAYSSYMGDRSSAESLPRIGWTGSYAGTAYVPGQGNNSHLAPDSGAHPVLLKAAAYLHPAYDSTARFVTTLILPRVVLYNPYNVRLKPGKYVVNITHCTFGATRPRFRFIRIQSDGSTLEKNSYPYLSWNGYNSNQSLFNFPGVRGDLTFILDNAEGMEPGESLLFCPDATRGIAVKGSKYAELQFSGDGDVSANVLSARVNPDDGSGYYLKKDGYNPDFPEWTGASDVSARCEIRTDKHSSGNHQLFQLVKLYQPSSSANLAAGLQHSELLNYNLLQVAHNQGTYEDKNAASWWRNAHYGTLTRSQVPDLSKEDFYASSLSDASLQYHALGMRLLKDQEANDRNNIPSIANQYPLFAQRDLRAPYIGQVWSLTQFGAGARSLTPRNWVESGGTNYKHSAYFFPLGDWWISTHEGGVGAANIDDPLHISNDAPIRGVTGRSEINVLHPFSRTGTGGVDADNTPVPLYELPRQEVPITSLAFFRHCPINPHVGGPTYTIGTSHGTRMSPRNSTATTWSDLQTSLLVTDGYLRNAKSYTTISSPQQSRSGSWYSNPHARYQIYDYSYEANHGLFDRFFLTGIEGDPGSGSQSGAAASLPSDSTDASRVDRSVKLPNSRLLANPFTDSPPLKTDITGYYTAANSLVIDGAFNVNSTDPLAWQALLSSFRNLDLPRNDGGSQDLSERSSFSRLLSSLLGTGDEPTGVSGYVPVWQQTRALTDKQIETLSLSIVQQVKRRRPFVSLADFVNRRLVGGDPYAGQMFGPSSETEWSKLGLRGALDAAIEASGINNTTADGAGSPS
ncbi:MAG: hypothetical protein H7A51_18085 [Akkermansiaceae bacterium]|nr:hypothetical protein [Akkermansiaceae bacterium]